MTSLSWQCFVDFALAVDPGELEIDKMQRYGILNQSLKRDFPLLAFLPGLTALHLTSVDN